MDSLFLYKQETRKKVVEFQTIWGVGREALEANLSAQWFSYLYM